MSREQFEAWGMSDVDLRITLESETYAGIAWMAWQAATASMQSERDHLAAQLADVVAENAALKEFSDSCAPAIDFWDRWADAEDKIASAPETPATDRFLVEQLAKGVEIFAASLKVVGGQEHPYTVVAKEFAAKLRNEVKV